MAACRPIAKPDRQEKSFTHHATKTCRTHDPCMSARELTALPSALRNSPPLHHSAPHKAQAVLRRRWHLYHPQQAPPALVLNTHPPTPWRPQALNSCAAVCCLSSAAVDGVDCCQERLPQVWHLHLPSGGGINVQQPLDLHTRQQQVHRESAFACALHAQHLRETPAAQHGTPRLRLHARMFVSQAYELRLCWAGAGQHAPA